MISKPILRSATADLRGRRRADSVYYLKARNKEQLAKRSNAHRILAEPSYGFLGRSPDYIASFVTGTNLKPEIFGSFADNVRSYYAFMRDRDIFAAMQSSRLRPRAIRLYQRQNLPNPCCRVMRRGRRRRRDHRNEDAGHRFDARDEIWIGNILPLAPEAKAKSITFAVPCNLPRRLTVGAQAVRADRAVRV